MAKLEKEKDLLAKKVSEAEKGSLEIILPEPMQADRLVLELMEDGDRISRYTIEGLVDRNWQTLSSGTRIGYRVVQPLMEASAPEQGISDWTKTDLPHPPVPKEYYWAGFPVNEPPREINSEGWYRKQFTIPSEWEGKDLVLQVGQDGVLVDNDVIGAVYFNGSRVGNSWAMAWKDGYGCISGTWPVAKASLYAGSPPAGGAWFKPRHYYVPHWLVRSGVDNYITVWVSDVGGQSGIYEGPIFVVSTEDKKIDLDGVWQMQTLYAAGEKSVMVSKIRLECLSELKPQIKKIAVYTKSTNSKKTVVFRR